MEIHGTIHFKLILPHFPGFQQEPLPEPVCSHSPDCKDCPYPRHGFLCWGADGTCLRTRMNKINGSEENKMMIQAVLSNPSHPEYGVGTIPFPIPRDQYAHCMELLAALEIGDAVKADCKVEEVDSFYTVLKRVEMLTVNVEELNYLAKRLDSFDTGEAAQFQAMAHKLELFELKDLMNLHGGSASVDELNALDGKGTARQLIESGKVIELPSQRFQQFSRALLADYDFIAENKNSIRHDDDARHCLLILDAEGKDGFLVDPQGYNYARYSAFVPNARSLLTPDMGNDRSYLSPVEPWRDESRDEMLRMTLRVDGKPDYTLVLPADEEYLDAVKRYTKLNLPVSSWELWDALDKVRLQTDDILYMEIEDYYAFEYLAPHLDGLEISLNELNDLAALLSALDEVQEVVLDGFLRM